jgi:protease YdgD
LSGHVGCEAVEVNADSTLEHRCDTTRGDSGSPIMVVRDGVYGIIAVDSNFRSITDGPPVNIAAHALGFARYLDQFLAGEVGTSIAPERGFRRPSKPGAPARTRD